MTLRDYTANVISASKVVPDGNFKDSKASGVWDINEALDLIKGGNWPNAANINPAAFVDALFQCHLYDGTGSQQTITNNIDFTKGGLIITKRRDSSTGNGPYWNDTERGVTNYVRSDSDGGTGAQNTSSTGAVVSTSSTGYVVGTFNGWNNSSGEYVSWTFRKQPKFFDIVTYSGTGSNQSIDHNLNSIPGMILVKKTSGTENWAVYHRGANAGTDPEDYYLRLNTTDDQSNSATRWQDAAPTSTQFHVGTSTNVNGNGETYIAYLFAHNNNDGGFGEPGDQDIIKCGHYTGNGSSTGPSVNLGFEPQFVMIKSASGNEAWYVYDSMRGMVVGGDDAELAWNSTSAENGILGTSKAILDPTPTGFNITNTSSTANTNTHTYIYMAIRRGGMQTPTAASDVFEPVAYTGNGTTGRVIGSIDKADLVIAADRDNDSTLVNYGTIVFDRLRGENLSLQTNSNAAQVSGWKDTYFNLDQSGGWRTGDGSGGINYFNKSSSDYISWAWKRAHSYFDMVAYSGTGSATTVTHNLGVAPEMMWVKRRDSSGDWIVYHTGLDSTNPSHKYLELNSSDSVKDTTVMWNDTEPTSSVFSVGTNNDVNASGSTYIAYLFATVAGVSKVGSYTGTGSDINIDCGFTSGARFVLIKNINAAEHWFVFDSARGITTATNDPFLYLSITNGENPNNDIDIDPLSSGFKVASGTSQINGNGNTHIFYAIA